jgi:hypothetical protein
LLLSQRCNCIGCLKTPDETSGTCGVSTRRESSTWDAQSCCCGF